MWLFAGVQLIWYEGCLDCRPSGLWRKSVYVSKLVTIGLSGTRQRVVFGHCQPVSTASYDTVIVVVRASYIFISFLL